MLAAEQAGIPLRHAPGKHPCLCKRGLHRHSLRVRFAQSGNVKLTNMNTTLETLIRLEKLTQQYEKEDQKTNLRKQINNLRAELPESLLRRFDHLAERGRLPIAQVSESGGCGSCHMKLPLADVLRIRSSSHVLPICPFCGCVLYAPAATTEEKETTAVAS